MKNDFNNISPKALTHTFNTRYKNNIGNIFSAQKVCEYGFSQIVTPEEITKTMNLSAMNFNSDILKLITDFGMEDPIITRIDFRWDFFDIDYAQLYRNFLLLDIMFYAVSRKKKKNFFLTFDPISGKIKTVCIKSHDSEAEYYNKKVKNPNLGIAARFEYRLKNRRISIDEEFDVKNLIFEVFEDFKKCVTKENYVAAINLATESILYGANKSEKFTQKSDKTSFLKKCSYLIFSYNQLVHLCKKLFYELEGYEDEIAEEKAKNKAKNMNIKKVTIRATLEDTREEEMTTSFNYISFAETKALVNMLFKAILGYLKGCYKDASKAEIRDLYERVKPFVNYREVKEIIN